MYTRILIGLLIAALLMAAPALAHDDAPTVAIPSLGSVARINLAMQAILDTLRAYEIISEEEYAIAMSGEEVMGENINIITAFAGFDLPTANILVEQLLDRGVDYILPISTTMAQIATSLTQDLEQPPFILFSIVTAPYVAGIAQSPCIKPAHVSGTHLAVPYDKIAQLTQVQDPNIQSIGTFVNAAIPSSVLGAETIVETGEAMGVHVEVASIVMMSDLAVAVDQLIDHGVEALVLVPDPNIVRGVPAIVEIAMDNSVPVFGYAPAMAYEGAIVGAGVVDHYREGAIVGKMLIAHMNGQVDISKLAINSLPSLGIGINLDTAKESAIALSDELLALADFIIEDGESSEDLTMPSLPEMPLDERREADLAFLAGLECRPERIAEEQAALDAAGG